jgi:uncharacterized protein with GYD domain
MPRYMIQFSYTSEAWAALAKNPEDRSGALGQLLETLGGRLESLDYTMGDYDGVAIAEAPDDTTAVAAVIAAVSPGHVRGTKTTKLISPADMITALQKAGSVTYRGPRQ